MQSETTQAKVIMISREDIERWFGILEFLLFKATFFVLAAIGAYHLIVRHGL